MSDPNHDEGGAGLFSVPRELLVSADSLLSCLVHRHRSMMEEWGEKEEAERLYLALREIYEAPRPNPSPDWAENVGKIASKIVLGIDDLPKHTSKLQFVESILLKHCPSSENADKESEVMPNAGRNEPPAHITNTDPPRNPETSGGRGEILPVPPSPDGGSASALEKLIEDYKIALTHCPNTTLNFTGNGIIAAAREEAAQLRMNVVMLEAHIRGLEHQFGKGCLSPQKVRELAEEIGREVQNTGIYIVHDITKIEAIINRVVGQV